MRCTLCFELTHNKIYNNDFRAFYHCLNCDLIFVPFDYHLNAGEEKNQYDFHQNGPYDEGYKQFLMQLVRPLLDHLDPGMQGLDFGSGPGPTLHLLLEEAGYPTEVYDPYYAPNEQCLKQQYDFVTSTEVVEHFSVPCTSWQQLGKLIKENGYLAIMTLLHQGADNFSSWWYKNDLTHVAFYSRQTVNWIAKRLGLELIYSDEKRVMIFRKSSEA